MSLSLNPSVISSAYFRAIESKPLLTHGVIAFTICSLGDILCQTKIEKHRVDSKRTLQLGLIRAVRIMPFLLSWYAFLPKVIPGTSPLEIILRCCIDQLVASPIMIVMVFSAMVLINGGSLQDVFTKMKKDFVATWKKGVQFWPLVHNITYRLPLDFQPLFTNFASIYWNGILSYFSAKSKDRKTL